MVINNINWNNLIGQIKREQCTLVISNRLIGALIFGDTDLASAWATDEGYPLIIRRNLTSVAQYISAKQGNTEAKSQYLEFLKQHLLTTYSITHKLAPDFSRQLNRELPGLSFSQLANERLKFPNFKAHPTHPLSRLALLDIPIYLTTSPHCFIEAALTAFGKEPRTEIYPWREDLEWEHTLLDKVLPDPNFIPTVPKPLVFHLHGIDAIDRSLVLTEDDYLDFLVRISEDMRTDVKRVPSSVRIAVSTHRLLLIGYHLQAWDLRVLMRGMLKDKRFRQRSFTVQLNSGDPNKISNVAGFRDYLKNYFNPPNFDIYWGTPQEFIEELWKAAEGTS